MENDLSIPTIEGIAFNRLSNSNVSMLEAKFLDSDIKEAV